MLKISTFFENPYKTDYVSRENWERFVEDHLANIRQSVKRGEPLQGMLTATETLYQEYCRLLYTINSERAEKIALSFELHKVIKMFKQLVSKREGLIRSCFGKNTPEYVEFFPRGLDPYNNARKKNIDGLFAQIINASEFHKVVIGDEMLNEFTGLYQKYREVHEEQGLKVSSVISNSVKIDEAMDKLKCQLYLNILQLAIHYVDNPGKGIAFFQQSLLKSHKRKKKANTGKLSE